MMGIRQLTMELLDRIRQNQFEVDDPGVNSFVSTVLQNGLSDTDTAHLAEALAYSGSTIKLGEPVTDLPSTGGPASLSTLVVPLTVALAGKKVLKVSVPGNLAGALDTLETLPGYKSHLSEREVRELAARTPYIHIAAGNEFAPADAKIYKVRRKLGAVICPELGKVRKKNADRIFQFFVVSVSADTLRAEDAAENICRAVRLSSLNAH